MCRPILRRDLALGGPHQGLAVLEHEHRELAVVQPRRGQEAARLGVGDVEPAVRDAVARDEVAGGVGLGREPVADDPQPRLGQPRRRLGLPVLQQLVEHRVEARLGRAPRLHQVVVEAQLVDRPDRGLGVGVGREQHALGLGGDLDGLGQELDPAHAGHALVGDQHAPPARRAGRSPRRSRSPPRRSRRAPPGGATRTVAQVPLDRAADRRIVVDRQDERAHRGRTGHRADPIAPAAARSGPCGSRRGGGPGAPRGRGGWGSGGRGGGGRPPPRPRAGAPGRAGWADRAAPERGGRRERAGVAAQALRLPGLRVAAEEDAALVVHDDADRGARRVPSLKVVRSIVECGRRTSASVSAARGRGRLLSLWRLRSDLGTPRAPDADGRRRRAPPR